MSIKKLILTVAGIFVVGALALSACTDKVEQTSSVREKPNSTTNTEANKESKPDNKVYKVGDTVSINGMEVTIKSAKFTPPADEYTQPSNGNILTVEVEAVNNGASQEMIFDGDFNLYGADGNSYQAYYGYTEPPLNANLNKGKKVTGKLYFDVTKESNYELIYTTFLGTEVKFNIVPQQ